MLNVHLQCQAPVYASVLFIVIVTFIIEAVLHVCHITLVFITQSDLTMNWSSVVGGGSLIAQQRREIKLRIIEITCELSVLSIRAVEFIVCLCSY